MKTEYLKEFLAVAKLGSFSSAAEALFISQSSLSKHIKQLEKELDMILFDRSTRTVTLSDFGNELLPLAEKICLLDDEILQMIRQHDKEPQLTVSIASVPVMAHYNITGAINRFQMKYPSIRIRLKEFEGNVIQKALENGECELAFQRITKENEGLADRLLFADDRLVAVLPESHPLSDHATIQLADIAGDDFLMLGADTALFDLAHQACQEAGFVPNVAYTSQRPENLIELVRSQMGVALMMAGQATYYSLLGVRIVELTPCISREMCLTKLKGKKLSKNADIFWQFIEQLQ